MRVFRLTENKPILLVLAKVTNKKKFFSSLQRHNCGIPQISLISTDIFTKREKSAILFQFFFFFV